MHTGKIMTLHCFLTNETLIKVTESHPYRPGFHTKQVSHPLTDRSVPGLSDDT